MSKAVLEDMVNPELAEATLHINGIIADKKRPPALVVGMHSPLQNSNNLLLKRAIDIVLSLVVIVFILPWLVPLMALIIKLDSRGPVFFLQKRTKKKGALFTCIKFRTMILNEEADTRAAGREDERITRVGAFLRAHHIDELPQVINVLMGDMSLIGPRPYMVTENERLEKMIEGYNYRHTVKPGITGLAQSMGYFGFIGDLDKTLERMELDFLYIREWSAGMDVQILARTFLRFIGRGEKQ